MPALINCRGDDDDIRPASLFRVLSTPRKRSRVVCAPFIFQQYYYRDQAEKTDDDDEPKKKKLICHVDALPDECLFEIFRRLSGRQERSVAACVSRRWLTLLSTLRSSDVHHFSAVVVSSHWGKQPPPLQPDYYLNGKSSRAADEDGDDSDASDSSDDDGGYLTRCLQGKKATDTRLSAMAIGIGGRGGLGKLFIRGSSDSRVTDLGLSAVARGCPSLRVLSLWDAPLIGDEGLSEIAAGCPMLEKLDLRRCASVSDKGLSAIAASCPKLTSLEVESCPEIGNEGLKDVGRCCPNLQSVSITGCPRVGDQGVASLVSSAAASLGKIKLQGLNDITDASLGVIGLYGRMVGDLVLSGLQKVGERGFWVMGAAGGLKNLKSLTVISCGGGGGGGNIIITERGLEAVAKGCPLLKRLALYRCSHLSDAGLRAFAGAAAGSLEHLQLEECHRITLPGVLAALSHCSERLKTLSLVKCAGIKDYCTPPLMINPSSFKSLRSLSIRHCPGFGGGGSGMNILSVIGERCPLLQHVDLSGLPGVTDAGLIPLVESCCSTESGRGLVKVNLSGCVNLTDTVVSALARVHGGTLRVLGLEGCRKVTDAAMLAVAENCSGLVDLDVSRCAVTDYGMAALACARQLQVLSLAGCSGVSGRSLPLLGNLGRSLVGLNLQRCCMISPRVIGSLEEKMWWCDILS